MNRILDYRQYILDRSSVDENGCWIWQRGIDRWGYGRANRYQHGQILAHRLAYEIFREDIKEGMHIDHVCRTRACVNPYHLDVVTQFENNLRKPQPTHCKYGHPLSGENARIVERRRFCRACDVRRHREYKLRLESRA